VSIQGDHIESWFGACAAGQKRHQLLTMMLDAVYVDMTQGLVLGLKLKPEFLPLFNLGKPVTTGNAELVTGGMEQGPTAQQLTFQESRWIQIGSIAWLKKVM
jgi:hypothetical protein